MIIISFFKLPHKIVQLLLFHEKHYKYTYLFYNSSHGATHEINIYYYDGHIIIGNVCVFLTSIPKAQIVSLFGLCDYLFSYDSIFFDQSNFSAAT